MLLSFGNKEFLRGINMNNKQLSTAQNGRIKYFEIMRIVAIALVIFNHLPGYTLYMTTTGARQWIDMVISMITRINVPIFFMISGALLLKKEEDYLHVLKKRALRILIVIVLFNFGLFVLCTVKAQVKGGVYDSSLKNLIHGIFAGTLERAESYWFLYAYLGFLLMLPFLQRIAKGITKNEFYAIIVLHFIISSLIPIANCIIGAMSGERIALSGSFAVSLATVKAFFYPLIGYYLDNCVDIESVSAGKMGKLWILTAAGICISCIITFLAGVRKGEFSQDYVQLFDYVSAITIFLFIKKCVVSRKEKKAETKKVFFDIGFVGSLTFGIYLFDPYIKEIIYNPFSRAAEKILPVMVVSFLWIPISMLVGGTITAILKKIPPFRRLL